MKQLYREMEAHLNEYRPLPFWSWNDWLEPTELKKQIHWMKENGIGGFFMHARGGLKTPYLSDAWMNCIEVCCEEAEKLGMEAWVYDENGWPSGFVGGKLLEKKENRDRYITTTIGFFDADADCSYLIEKERLLRVHTGEFVGTYLNLYLHYSASTVDILNPEVVEQFLTETHCKYEKHFTKRLSQKLRGFFTDEPQYHRWNTPYTPMIAEYFQKEYKEDIFDKLGLLFLEKEGYREFRYRYWCAMQKLMLQNFSKKVYEWCDEKGVKLTGHYIEEVSMGLQNMCCGGVMPFYEYQHIPGIDWLTRSTDNELSPRQLGSVARQLGKKQALTETFALCGWDVSPAELRRIAGFQYANGVNRMCHHLIPYSEHGQRKRDYPAHFSKINPWVKESFKEFNDYFAKLGCLLGEGEEPVNVAIFHPMRSSYFDYKRGDEGNGFGIQELENKLLEACRIFSSRGIAYHFLDETLLERHGFVRDNKIGCGKCVYDYLVIPKILTMGSYTEKLLRQFIRNGGKVLLLEEAPQYLEGKPYQYDYLLTNCTLEEIIEAQPFVVEDNNTEIYCAYRMIQGKPFLFLQNNSHTESYTQTFEFADGSRSFLALDPVNMSTNKLPLTVTLQEDESMILFPVQEPFEEIENPEEIELTFTEAMVDFETNYLTVDALRYSKDGINYSDLILTNELFTQLLEERYYGKIWLRYEFEIRVVPQNISLLVEKAGVMDCSVNGRKVTFTDSWEDDNSFHILDITEFVHEGINVYEAVLDWYQSEKTYYALFGKNVTESLKNCIAYDSEIEPIYLCGKFGVYSDKGFEQHDNETVCASNFYIGEVPQKASEPVKEGFPFFRGNFTVTRTFNLENPNVILNLRGRYLAARVHVNGQNVGKLIFNRRIDISQYAVEGENQLEVQFTVGNRNLMGPLHHSWPEVAITPGSFGVCNTPKNIDGSYQYKFYLFYPKGGKTE